MAKRRQTKWISAPKIYGAFRKYGMFPNGLWDKAKDGLALLHFDQMVVDFEMRSLEKEVAHNSTVPDWFWAVCGKRRPSRDNWVNGNLIVRGRLRGRQVEVRLYGFGFDASVVRDMLPQARKPPERPAVPSGELEKWFRGYLERCGGVENLPTNPEIHAAAKRHFPRYSVGRDRLRAIQPPKKPGPKRIGGE